MVLSKKNLKDIMSFQNPFSQTILIRKIMTWQQITKFETDVENISIQTIEWGLWDPNLKKKEHFGSAEVLIKFSLGKQRKFKDPSK